MLFGVRLRSLFTSRWMAILWAILVCLTAIQFVGTSDDEKSGRGDSGATDGLTPQQRQDVANAL